MNIDKILNPENESEMLLFEGRIANLKSERMSAEFLFTVKHKKILFLSMLASIFSNEGPSTMYASGLLSNTAEPADFLSFSLDGMEMEACVWSSVFVEGDFVQIAAKRIEGRWKGIAIYRPSDGATGVYPHCTRGRYAHAIASVKWILAITLFLFSGISGSLLITLDPFNDVLSNSPLMFIAALALAGIFGVIGSLKSLRYVRFAEEIFSTFKWKDVKWINLRARSKDKEGAIHKPAFLTTRFKYFPKT